MLKLNWINQRVLIKTEKIIFGLFIFTLPFGTRKLLYSELAGNNFFAAFLYLSDILLAFIFVLWFLRVKLSDFIDKRYFLLLIFLLILLFSTLMNFNLLSFYHFIRILIGILLIIYISLTNFHDKNLLIKIFIYSIAIQSLIGIAQFNLQHSVNLKILGEPILGPDILGLAKIDTAQGKFIRAYGTLPHPNVLSVFLFTGFAVLIYKILFIKKEALDYLLTFLIIGGLFLTFSRAAYFVFFIFLLILFLYIYQYHRQKLKQFIHLSILIICLISLLGILFWPILSKRINLRDEALLLRNLYNLTAIKMIENNLIFGVGPGNFVKAMNNYLPNQTKLTNFWEFQPVHNVFLLLAAEGGILVAAIFIFFLLRPFYLLFNKILSLKQSDLGITLIVTFCFIILMFFDHYFLTIWQSFLLMCITLGIIWGLITKSLKSQHVDIDVTDTQ